MPRVLISVHDKTGLVDLGRRLSALKWDIVASGGTAAELSKAGVPCVGVEEVTGNPEAFGGRVKTISFKLASGILYDRRLPAHIEEAEKYGVAPVDMVICNFYPFEATTRQQRPLDEVVEMIDVGGPTMVRAAAKNFHAVAVVTQPEDYDAVCHELEESGEVSLATRRRLAWTAFLRLSQYDMSVARYLGEDATHLRYGENPHQRGWFFPTMTSDGVLRLGDLVHVQGKDLSYNNYLDLDAAILLMSHLGNDRPLCVIVKHANPCGVAVGPTIEEAFRRAWEGDATAAFGGVVIMNRELNYEVARSIVEQNRFLEVIATPSVDDAAMERLSVKRNLQILTHPDLARSRLLKTTDVHPVRGGILQQDSDDYQLTEKDLKTVTKKAPDSNQIRDLLFAWNVCKVTRSNAITIVKDEMLVGSGAGQQDRVRCCKIAVDKAGPRAKDSAAASDGFFPFTDGPALLMAAGVQAIVQPGGSIRDQECIDACNEAGVAMCFTSVRCFKH